MNLRFAKYKVGQDAYKISKTYRLGFHAFRTEHFSILRLCYLRDKRGTHYVEIIIKGRCYDTCGERREE